MPPRPEWDAELGVWKDGVVPWAWWLPLDAAFGISRGLPSITGSLLSVSPRIHCRQLTVGTWFLTNEFNRSTGAIN